MPGEVEGSGLNIQHIQYTTRLVLGKKKKARTRTACKMRTFFGKTLTLRVHCHAHPFLLKRGHLLLSFRTQECIAHINLSELR